MIESLENRTLFSSSVALFDPSGHPASLNRHLAVWLLVHGDNMNESLMRDMATAVQAQLPSNQWQVLDVDWSAIAAHDSSGDAEAVGDVVAAMIERAHLPAARVNLIGFSSGGTVIGEIAADLKTKTSQVNRIVGVDPRDSDANYAENSNYSIAFGGRDRYGKEAGTLAADDAVLLTGLSTDDLQRHSDVFDVVTTMWQRDAGLISKGNDTVSSLFSIDNILDGPTPEWKPNAFLSGYEAEIPCGTQAGLPNNLGPLSLKYLNLHGRTRIIA